MSAHVALVVSTATDPATAAAEMDALAASYAHDANGSVLQYDAHAWDPAWSPTAGARVGDLPTGLVVNAVISYAAGWRLTGLTDLGNTAEQTARYRAEFDSWLAANAGDRAALLRYWF